MADVDKVVQEITDTLTNAAKDTLLDVFAGLYNQYKDIVPLGRFLALIDGNIFSDDMKQNARDRLVSEDSGVANEGSTGSGPEPLATSIEAIELNAEQAIEEIRAWEQGNEEAIEAYFEKENADFINQTEARTRNSGENIRHSEAREIIDERREEFLAGLDLDTVPGYESYVGDSSIHLTDGASYDSIGRLADRLVGQIEDSRDDARELVAQEVAANIQGARDDTTFGEGIVAGDQLPTLTDDLTDPDFHGGDNNVVNRLEVERQLAETDLRAEIEADVYANFDVTTAGSSAAFLADTGGSGDIISEAFRAGQPSDPEPPQRDTTDTGRSPRGLGGNSDAGVTSILAETQAGGATEVDDAQRDAFIEEIRVQTQDGAQAPGHGLIAALEASDTFAEAQAAYVQYYEDYGVSEGTSTGATQFQLSIDAAEQAGNAADTAPATAVLADATGTSSPSGIVVTNSATDIAERDSVIAAAQNYFRNQRYWGDQWSNPNGNFDPNDPVWDAVLEANNGQEAMAIIQQTLYPDNYREDAPIWGVLDSSLDTPFQSGGQVEGNNNNSGGNGGSTTDLVNGLTTQQWEDAYAPPADGGLTVQQWEDAYAPSLGGSVLAEEDIDDPDATAAAEEALGYGTTTSMQTPIPHGEGAIFDDRGMAAIGFDVAANDANQHLDRNSDGRIDNVEYNIGINNDLASQGPQKKEYVSGRTTQVVDLGGKEVTGDAIAQALAAAGLDADGKPLSSGSGSGSAVDDIPIVDSGSGAGGSGGSSGGSSRGSTGGGSRMTDVFAGPPSGQKHPGSNIAIESTDYYTRTTTHPTAGTSTITYSTNPDDRASFYMPGLSQKHGPITTGTAAVVPPSAANPGLTTRAQHHNAYSRTGQMYTDAIRFNSSGQEVDAFGRVVPGGQTSKAFGAAYDSLDGKPPAQTSTNSVVGSSPAQTASIWSIKQENPVTGQMEVVNQDAVNAYINKHHGTNLPSGAYGPANPHHPNLPATTTVQDPVTGIWKKVSATPQNMAGGGSTAAASTPPPASAPAAAGAGFTPAATPSFTPATTGTQQLANYQAAQAAHPLAHLYN